MLLQSNSKWAKKSTIRTNSEWRMGLVGDGWRLAAATTGTYAENENKRHNDYSMQSQLARCTHFYEYLNGIFFSGCRSDCMEDAEWCTRIDIYIYIDKSVH